MPVSSRALGWLTATFLALAATAAILGVFVRPRTIYVYLLVIGWVVLSSVAGGLTAGFMHPGAVAKRSSTWPVALWCMMVGVYIGLRERGVITAEELAAGRAKVIGGD
jgi:hypothetical protein